MFKRSIPVLLAVLLAAFAFGARSAHAETLSPWLHLTSVSRPTNLHAGIAKNAVWEVNAATEEFEVEPGVTVPTTAFTMYIVSEGKKTSVGMFATEGLANSTLGKGLGLRVASAANVQSALEVVVGTGNVSVTGGPGGTAPLVVSFLDQAGPTLEAEKLLEARASAVQLSEGQADGELIVTLANLGDAAVNGSGADGPIVITDTLPPGLKATGLAAGASDKNSANGTLPLECSLGSPLTCRFTGTVPPYSVIEVHIQVKVEPGARTGEENEASVSGGGAPSAQVRHPITISDQLTPFGVEQYELTNENAGGTPDTQAGSHPFQQTTTFDFNTSALSGGQPITAALVKDLSFRWPPGLIGNPQPLVQCAVAAFLTKSCPVTSAIGVARAVVATNLGTLSEVVPLFNIKPSVGEPARFAFLVENNPTFIDPAIRAGEDYGITVHVYNITQTITVLSSQVTVWGIPGEASHDNVRGYTCLEEAHEAGVHGCIPPVEGNPPFLTMPTSCATNPSTGEPDPLRTTLEADSWAQPGVFTPPVGEPMPALDGCNRLPFEPSIQVASDGHAASSPSGLLVNVEVPQEDTLNPKGLAEADVRNTTVALPGGVTINPAGSDGLEACSEPLIGYLPGESKPPEELRFTPTVPGSIGSSEPLEPGVNFCSNGSKIGTVRIKTPVLPNDLTGAVYLASQNANPFGSLLAMYAVAEEPIAGVLLKLPGEVKLCQVAGEVVNGMRCAAAGQLVATLLNTPQAPFEEAEFHFFGGERAPLGTPAHCGSYTTTTSIAPWSGNEPSHPSSTYEINEGPDNTPCPGASLPFNPTATGGATDIQAGEYSPFAFTMIRQNGEQNLQSGEVKLPPGVSGMLSNVELCPEPQANEGTCGPNSLIGETTVSIGVGSKPYPVRGGKIYLTGPYDGTGGCTPGTSGCAPFGLSVVNPAKAGPYDLKRNTANPAGEDACDCVLVRAKIEVNPETAGLTVVSDPPGSPDAIPTSLEGIPLEIQDVNVTTTRSAFQFNPTNCSKMQVVGNLFSAEGGADTITVPFQVTNCAALKFEPKFSVSTSGKTSRADGASLTVKLSYPNVPRGTDADIKQVKVELPKALPSRLTTLQKACKQAQFRSNPAGCPADSIIGHVKAVVPNIPVPLQGPAYFVSNGSEAFPNLVLVLQGYNVTIDLVGDTFINKAGITSSTFKTVPDNPVSTFELTLPEGKYSALTANTNLCKVKNLAMPTEFVGQNGAEIHETTKIQVTGCPKAKKTKKTKHRKKPTHKKKHNKHKR